ncbi:MAG: GGDEF domain-containing protein [Planctomycetes bacterium]|nr:GGDEF domain-containing protein [Planctomycetota bacterium]
MALAGFFWPAQRRTASKNSLYHSTDSGNSAAQTFALGHYPNTTTLPDTTSVPNSPNETPQKRSMKIVLLNHGGGNLAELLALLLQSGYQVRESTSLAESFQLLADTRPDAIVLSPLGLLRGGVELELVEGAQRDDDPVPLLVLLPDLRSILEVRLWKLMLRDFVQLPFAATECLHRLELLLIHRDRYRMLMHRTRDLEGQLSNDFKTGLLSEVYFNRLLLLEWKRSQRHQTPMSLMLLDIDNFKRVNDSTEYAFGDEVLRRVGAALRASLRETDFAARCGGDEFCVLLPHTTPAEAVHTAMRIRQRIAETVIQKGTYLQKVTVSIGIDAFDGRSLGSAEILRSNANKALLQAKRKGKNQVSLFASEPGATTHG